MHKVTKKYKNFHHFSKNLNLIFRKKSEFSTCGGDHASHTVRVDTGGVINKN